jgi:hypothetical protein
MYPDLTDWATVGVLLGMVVEACRSAEKKADWWLPYFYMGEFDTWQAMVGQSPSGPRLHRAVYPLLGQALAELLLELWGET